jgi:hypothetical protein
MRSEMELTDPRSTMLFFTGVDDPLRWKQEKLKLPISRRDEERALPYSQYKNCLNRLMLAHRL